MTFDESNARITENLCGRTIEHVYRKGKELLIRTTCGHEIKLQADVKGDIHFKGCAVKIMLDSIPMSPMQGSF